MKFIVGVNDDSVLVNKKITRAGLPIYRAYLFSIIQEAGYYRLAGSISNQITITVSNVQLNLGGNTVTGGITINSNLKNVTINNGTVIGSGSTAITVSSGCSSIRILDVSIQGSGVTGGIFMAQTFDSTVRNCEMIQNTTGIVLTNCANITVQNCTATRSIFEGYSLLSSTTCTISACKALSTGADNTNTNLTTAIGFASSGGVGNVFDKCIANSSQLLTTTDQSSVVAGFALRSGEIGSRITNCTASNSMAGGAGFTVPYGILLETIAAPVLTLTGTPPVPIPAGSFTNGSGNNTSCDWTPDARYFATTTTGAPYLYVYAIDKKDTIMNFVATSNVRLSSQLTALRWSPDGQYLACGSISTDTVEVRIYRFDPLNRALTFVCTSNTSGNSIQGLSWSSDRRYLAVSSNTATNQLRVFAFNSITQTLSLNASALAASSGSTTFCAFSPDNLYVATCTGSGTVTILSFNGATGTLTTVASTTVTGAGSTVTDMLTWSPDGLYLALASSSSVTQVYFFNRTNNAFTPIASTSTTTGASQWTPDGKYLITCSSTTVAIYFFDKNAKALIQQSLLSNNPFSARLTADGELLAVLSSNTGSILLYKAFNFPTQNMVMNNTVYCNSGDSSSNQSGIGMCGSSTSNFIVQNTIYSDPINPPVAPINFAYVTNVFNSLFQDTPTLMQNIPLGTCDPIPLRRNQPQSWDILWSKLVDISTKVDLIKP